METKDDNMTIFEFASDALFYTIVLAIGFQRSLFRPLENFTYIQSIVVLYALVIICLVGSIFLLRKKEKTGWDVLLTVAFPYGLYNTLAFVSGEDYIRIILVGTLLLVIAFVVAYIIHKFHYKKRFSKRHVFKVFLFSNRIIACAMCLVLITTCVQTLHDDGIIKLLNKSVVSGKESDETIEKNIDTLILLQQGKWRKLDKTEKLQVMQTVANIEAYRLGLPHELYVQAGNLNGSLATYADSSYTITLDEDHMMNADSFEVLRSVLHESFHGYSHRLVDLYQMTDEELKNLKCIQNAESYNVEFSNYTDPDIDFEGYYNMKSEKDARSYAENSMCEYYNQINDYLGIEPDSITDSDFYDDERYSVSYEEGGRAYLYDKSLDECIAGPYQMIYVDELYFKYDVACRYIGLNKKMGYLDKNGNEITPSMFIEASEMQDGIAMVKENINGGYYFIDSKGMRITEKEYIDAYEFEHQGNYARVKINDSTWGIINRKEEIVFTADSIEPLPLVTTLGGAIVDGHAVIFEIDSMENEEITIVKHLEEFSEISEIHCGYFAIVKSKTNNLYGIVDNDGDVVIPAQYSKIEYKFNEYTESFGQKTDFICYNQDGTQEVIKMEW